MSLPKPCLTCDEVTTNGSRCEECSDNTPKVIRIHEKKESRHTRGYDNRWYRLSKQARRLQPFCSNCGATDDLQADHSPEAWDRWEQGLAIRLQDIDVLCGPCNRKAGAARGDSKRSNTHDGTEAHDSAERPSASHTEPWGDIPERPRKCPKHPKSTDSYFPYQLSSEGDEA